MSYNDERLKRLQNEKQRLWCQVGEGLPDGVVLRNRREDYPDAWERDLLDSSTRETLGTVRINSGSGYYAKVAGFKLESDRIPNPRNQYRPSRNYKRVESLLSAIAEFCQPKTDNERTLEELRRKVTDLKWKRDRELGEHCVLDCDCAKVIRLLAQGDTDRATVLQNKLVATQQKRNDISRKYRSVMDPLVEKIYQLEEIVGR